MHTLKATMHHYADEIIAIVAGFAGAHLGMHCMLNAGADSVQHVLHGLDPATIDLVKFIITTLCGFIGTLGGLYVKLKVDGRRYNKETRKRNP